MHIKTVFLISLAFLFFGFSAEYVQANDKDKSVKEEKNESNSNKPVLYEIPGNAYGKVKKFSLEKLTANYWNNLDTNNYELNVSHADISKRRHSTTANREVVAETGVITITEGEEKFSILLGSSTNFELVSKIDGKIYLPDQNQASTLSMGVRSDEGREILTHCINEADRHFYSNEGFFNLKATNVRRYQIFLRPDELLQLHIKAVIQDEFETEKARLLAQFNELRIKILAQHPKNKAKELLSVHQDNLNKKLTHLKKHLQVQTPLKLDYEALLDHFANTNVLRRTIRLSPLGHQLICGVQIN